jgi:hypothetical protein
MGPDYRTLLDAVLARSRRSSGLNALVGVALVPLSFAAYGATWWVAVFVAIMLVLTLLSVRQWQRLRPGAPIVRALEQPATLDRVRGWPPLAADKYPANAVPVVLQVFAGDAECKLKMDKAMIHPFVRALRREAPALEIDVPVTLQ